MVFASSRPGVIASPAASATTASASIDLCNIALFVSFCIVRPSAFAATLPVLARGLVIALAKGAAEMGRIVEPVLEGDLGDRPALLSRVFQRSRALFEPPAQDVARDRLAFVEH